MSEVKRCTTCHFKRQTIQEFPCNTCTNFDKWCVSVLPITTVSGFNGTSTEGVKFDNDKPKWSLLPFKALTEVVDVLTYGARKYAPDNWKKVPDARTRYVDATFRHFTAYINGEKNDSETGKSHLAHAICCLLFLLAFDKGEHHDQSDSNS